MLQSRMSTLISPIPLAEIESVLAWVDGFNLSRPTRKISRDFSDAVLLAEILAIYYPKLVEMHNYPARNSHALKLNNWMTLNRKVLKKLKLNLCTDTMEQLCHSAPGVVERILIMVRDKIRRDEELNKSMKEAEQNMSSGGSYYEACGEDEHVLVVPVKARVNGVLEMVQQKVVTYGAYLAMKEELKDAKDATDLLKQKVGHLENMMKLKDERIDELQKQLERKASRRKEAEHMQNCLGVPFSDTPLTPKTAGDTLLNNHVSKLPIKNVKSYTKSVDNNIAEEVEEDKEVKNTIKMASDDVLKPSSQSDIKSKLESEINIINSKFSNKEVHSLKENVTAVNETESVRSEESIHEAEQKNSDEEFKDSLQDLVTTTIDESIQREIKVITNQLADNIDSLQTPLTKDIVL